jgi:FtsZ-binding cell division protein ZapB
MALPYYLKVNPDLVEELKTLKQDLNISQTKKTEIEKKLQGCQKKSKNFQKKMEQLKKESTACKKRVQQLEGKVNSLSKELSKTFCVIKLNWESPYKEDVDLHVVDPNGHEFYFAKRTYPNTSASLTVDSIGVKKGAEVWIDKQLSKGIYTIKYVYYSGSGSVTVHGMVLTKSFTKDLPLKKIQNPKKNRVVTVAKIIVDSNGNAILQTN